MTIHPLPVDPAPLYSLMGPAALLAHVRAAVAQLEIAGVQLSTESRAAVDAIEEDLLEHYARTNPAALAQHLRGLERDLALAS